MALDLLDVHDENVSVEIAQVAEMLARHVLASMSYPLQTSIAVEQRSALAKTARRYEVLLMLSGATHPNIRAKLEERLDTLIT